MDADGRAAEAGGDPVDRVEMIVMAFSQREGGRCIAGIRSDGGGWLRPVSAIGSEELKRFEYMCEDGRDPSVLDRVNVPIGHPRPQPWQPENVVCVRGERWGFVGEGGARERFVAQAFAQDEDTIIGCSAKKKAVCEFEEGVDSSLTVVRPQDLLFDVSEHGRYQRIRPNAVFRLGPCKYDLAITDSVWRDRLTGLTPAMYTPAKAGVPTGQAVLLTVSLAAPYEGSCYKLVAGIICVPAHEQLEALERRIVRVLIESGRALRAREIARRITSRWGDCVERTEVNSALYCGRLAGSMRGDGDSGWSF
jgi:hypothetical protein